MSQNLGSHNTTLRSFSLRLPLLFVSIGVLVTTVVAGDDRASVFGDDPVLSLKSEERRFFETAFSPDSSRVLVGQCDGTAAIWETASGQRVMDLAGQHVRNISSVRFAPDGQQVLTSGVDQKSRVWDAATGEEKSRWRGHTWSSHLRQRQEITEPFFLQWRRCCRIILYGRSNHSSQVQRTEQCAR